MPAGINRFGEVVEVPGDLFKIAEEVVERWPNLRIQYLDPDRASVGDAPYRVVEYTQNGPVVVCDVWQLDQSLITKLMMSDASKFDIQKDIEKHNAKVKEAERKKVDEAFAEGADHIKSATEHLRKGKLEFRYTNQHGQKRIIRDEKDGGNRDNRSKVL